LGKSRKNFKEGDLVRISTPMFHNKHLSNDLEGMTGIVMRVNEIAVPSDFRIPTHVTYVVLVDGKFVVFHSDRYMTKITSSVDQSKNQT
jgi:phage-related protein